MDAGYDGRFSGHDTAHLITQIYERGRPAANSFLEKIRVKQACDTISAGMSVSKAIDHSGFGDFQRMQRAFKRQLGTTIGEYEKRFVVRA